MPHSFIASDDDSAWSDSDTSFVYVEGETDTESEIRVDQAEVSDLYIESVDTNHPHMNHNEPCEVLVNDATTVIDPFTADPLPRGVLYGRSIRQVVASFFSPYERERFFQIVWNPQPPAIEAPTYDTTWCSFSELEVYLGDHINKYSDEDGQPLENYCFKNVAEFLFYRMTDYDFYHEGDDSATYQVYGRCNGMIWSEVSPRYDQRCTGHTTVPKSSPGYVPYCSHHHHAMHSPLNINRKRFYRGQWCGLILM